MTTIYIDANSGLVAADKQVSGNWKASKISILNSPGYGIVIATGTGVIGQLMYLFDLIECKQDPSTIHNGEQYTSCAFLTQEGSIFRISNDAMTNRATLVAGKVFAEGSGSDYLLSALHFGKTLEEAFCFAAKNDIYTSPDFDIVRLTDLPARPVA